MNKCIAILSGFSLACSLASAADKKGSVALRVKFVAAEDGNAVDGEVYYAAGNKENFRSNSGVAVLSKAPRVGEKLYLVPDKDEYSYTLFQWAPPNGTVSVESRPRSKRATYASGHVAKAEFLKSAGEPAAAALEFRKAALIAEKKHDKPLFNQLEYHVAEGTAKALGVPQPFVEAAGGVRSSAALKVTVQKYQRDRDLKPTGALNTDTIRDIAATLVSPEPGLEMARGAKPAAAGSPRGL